MRAVGQLEDLGHTLVLRSVTGEAQLLGPAQKRPEHLRVELWGQLVSAKPNQLLVHGLKPLAPQEPRRSAAQVRRPAPSPLRVAAGPFEGPVCILRCGPSLLAQDAGQRVYQLDWCCSAEPLSPGATAPARSTERPQGPFHVCGEIQVEASGPGWGSRAAVPTLRVHKAWPLSGRPASF